MLADFSNLSANSGTAISLIDIFNIDKVAVMEVKAFSEKVIGEKQHEHMCR